MITMRIVVIFAAIVILVGHAVAESRNDREKRELQEDICSAWEVNGTPGER